MPQWEQSAAAIRRRLTAGKVEAACSGLARYVGIETYEAAGGVVKRDLFDSEHSRFLADPALLQRLALEKLETAVTAVRDEGWAWVEGRLDLDALALRQFARADYDLRKPTADERKELAELDRRSRELELQSDGLRDRPEGWPDEAELIDLEEQDIAARQRAIQQGLQVWALEVKALAGVIVTVSREGDVAIIRGLVREADRKAVDAARRRHEKATCEPVGTRRGGASTTTTGASEPTGSTRATATESKRAEFSDALSRRLAAHRTLALQAVLARNVPVALAALANALAQRVLGDEYRRAGHALQITAQASAHTLAAAADDAKAASAWLALQAARDGWIERLPKERAAWFAWLLELPQAELLELMALCSALTANALPSAGAAFDANALAAAVGLDMADWWEPTAEGFLSHVSKAQIVQALKEAGSILGTDRVESMNKDLLVSTALARLKGKRWLPAPLRPPLV